MHLSLSRQVYARNTVDRVKHLSNLSLQAAQQKLRQFTCTGSEPKTVSFDAAEVRESLLLLASHSDYQLLGICADTVALGAQALQTYLKALGSEETPTVTPTEGPVYIKFNPKTGKCHVDRYIGNHRGVLVSCQSAYDGDINETFGHLPLDLFQVTEATHA